MLAQLTVENDEMGEQLFEHLFYVKDAKYTLNVSSSTGTENILPGTSFTVNTEVYKVTSESEKVQEVKLTPDQYSVEFEKTEGDERFQVDRATGKATVSDFDANEDRPEYRVLASVRVPGISEPVADGVIWFYVVPSYHVIEAKKDLIVTPGQTVSLADLGLKLKRFDKAHKDGIEESGGKTNFKIIAENPNKLTVNADGTAFTVSQTAVQAGKAEKAGYYVRATRDRYGNTIDAENYAEITICSHSFAQASRVEATCTAAGSVTSKCSVCGTTKTETIPAKGHTPGAWETTKAASCTAAGEQAQKCSVCGTVLGTKAIPAAGHSFGEWKLTTEPTAVAEGVETRTCGVCGAAETRSVAKLAGVIKLNVKKLPLQVKKSTTAVKVTQMAKGDSIASWKSSKPKIASVSKKGKITGKKKGTATITVTLKSGVKASVKVTVQKNKVTTTKLTVKDGTKTIKNKKLTMKKGAKTTLKTTLTPLTSTDKVTFSSSNKKIVTVSSKGKLTAKKAGKAKITVKAGKKKVVITVTVKKK